MNTTEVALKYTKDEYIQPPPGGHAACPGCGEILAMRYFLRGIGGKIALVSTAGCTLPVILTPKYILKYREETIPLVITPFGSTAICAGGVKTAFMARGDTETQVVVCAGDGAAFDIGFGGLSSAAERNEDIIYVCYDNEAYQNTGNQRSSATPWGAITTTNPLPAPKAENKKDTTIILAEHGIPYIATATVAYPDDLIRKAQKAKDIEGFRFLHILTPCPTGWLFPPEWTVKISRLAVETKVFPLFEVENGTALTINKEPEGVPIEEYIRIQGRYRHLTSEQIAKLQKDADERWDRLLWRANYKRKGV